MNTRPFASGGHLHEAMSGVVRAAGAEEQVALIRAHPDLVGRLAREGRLTRESAGEQAAAGLGDLSDDEIAAFERHNAAYRGRFFHGIVSVMPGPRRRTRFGPAEVTAVHPVLPLAARVGLGVGALTWGDSLHLGVVTEPGNNPETLAKAIVAEISALGRTS